MTHRAVQHKALSARLACQAFGISHICYRYQAGLSADNDEIANLLTRLTASQRNRGFGPCLLYPCNVKEYRWNHML